MSIREIANLAGVSPATVSRVLNGFDNVHPKTREVVQQAVDALGYEAASLVRKSKKKSKLVGLVVPDLDNPFFTEIILGAQSSAEKFGISFFICDTGDNDQKELQYLRRLKESQVSGILIVPVSDDDDSVNNGYLNLLSGMDIPIVLMDRDSRYSNFSGVFSDNQRGTYEATTLLFEKGHRKIGFIAGPINTRPGRERTQGYKEAYAIAKIPLDETLIRHGDFTVQSGYNETMRLLRQRPDITAIFACNNMMLLGCLKALREKEIIVPDEMALVGFDKLPYSEVLDIGLTVVEHAAYEIGQIGMDMLWEAMCGSADVRVRRVMLIPDLKIRGSEAYPKKPLTQRADFLKKGG